MPAFPADVARLHSLHGRVSEHFSRLKKKNEQVKIRA